MIEIIELHKSFGERKVLDGVNLTINEGETLAIIGRSGSGKSVLLKHIVGLLEPDSGDVKVEGISINNADSEILYKIRTQFGFLFQGAALFDSMTVEENVALPLIENNYGYSIDKVKSLVEEFLGYVGLTGIQQQKPAELSGGMKKRVSLARSLITKPKYILYDEPTTGLDPVMSDSIDELIKELSDKLGVTSIIVTHDMFSVKKAADKVAMLYEGKILFEGTTDEVRTSDNEIIRNFISRTGF